MTHNQRILSFICCLFLCMTMNAIPARRGLWRVITLNDGTRKNVELRGDEHFNFLADRDGNAYVENEWGTYDKTSIQQLIDESNKIKATFKAYQKKMEAQQRKRAPKKASGIPTDKSKFLGRKKGLVILAQYSDVKFSTTTPAQFNCRSTNALYDKIINTRNLDMEPFYGSVKDYFLEQSDGKFELDFDVVGPVTLSQPQLYYGAGLYKKSGSRYTKEDNDAHSGYMAYEAIQKAHNATKSDGSAVNFSDYDWDQDGEAEVVYVLYAGQGQADGGEEYTIWPHKFDLYSAKYMEDYYGQYTLYYKNINGRYERWSKATMTGNGYLTYNNTIVNIYACSNELATNGENGTQLNGIGTICHEFSHTMGYPDAYDTDYSYQGPQMGSWDLMCNGSYNGSWNGGNSGWSEVNAGYRPCGYTAFERWCAGWIEPIELTDPQKITKMKPLGGTRNGGVTDHGEAYVVYMPGSVKDIRGEYYLLENRQWANWDYDLPWFGLLINYVNYNESLWESNGLNTPSKAGFEHLTHFQAGGVDYLTFMEFDTYPYEVNYLPQIFSTNTVFYDEDGAAMAANINSWINDSYPEYEGMLVLNTADNRALTANSSPSAYYYGSGSTKRKLTDHEIWDIYYNDDDDRTVNFIYRYPQEKTLNLDQDVTAAQDFNKGLFANVTTNKPLTDGKYNSLWFPFDMSEREVSTYLGENTQIFRLANVSVDENGHFQLEITEDTDNGIKAYEPVFVKQDGGSTAININYYMQVNNTIAEKEPVVELSNGWKMMGTTSYGNIPKGAYFIGTKDGQQGFFKSSGTSKLRAYRAYFVAPENSEQNMSMATNKIAFKVSKHTGLNKSEEIGSKMIDMYAPQSTLYVPQDPEQLVSEGDGVPNSIQNISLNGQGNVYDLFGRKIYTNDDNAISKGIYIHHGKKIIIK